MNDNKNNTYTDAKLGDSLYDEYYAEDSHGNKEETTTPVFSAVKASNDDIRDDTTMYDEIAPVSSRIINYFEYISDESENGDDQEAVSFPENESRDHGANGEAAAAKSSSPVPPLRTIVISPYNEDNKDMLPGNVSYGRDDDGFHFTSDDHFSHGVITDSNKNQKTYVRLYVENSNVDQIQSGPGVVQGVRMYDGYSCGEDAAISQQKTIVLLGELDLRFFNKLSEHGATSPTGIVSLHYCDCYGNDKWLEKLYAMSCTGASIHDVVELDVE